MSLESLAVLKIIDKGLDIFYYLIRIDNKYNRRILYYQKQYEKYQNKYQRSKLQLQSSIGEKDEQSVKKITKKCEIYYDKIEFIKKRIEEYEKLSKNYSDANHS